jgi:hypothetical protein
MGDIEGSINITNETMRFRIFPGLKKLIIIVFGKKEEIFYIFKKIQYFLLSLLTYRVLSCRNFVIICLP